CNLRATRMSAYIQKTNPRIRKIGVAVGSDRSLIPCVIEVNMTHDPYIFNQLKDKSMYRKVMKYRRYWMEK
ncbi:endospore coat-associated protein, partial [Paenibacillus riograndensis]